MDMKRGSRNADLAVDRQGEVSLKTLRPDSRLAAGKGL